MKFNCTHIVDSSFFAWKAMKNSMAVFLLGGKWNHPAMLVSPYLQLLSLSYNVARDTEAMDADLVFLFYNRGIRTFNIVFINKSPLVCCKPREL
jgi:hypothetical protein